MPNLQKILTNASGSNGETSRVDFLAKYIFISDMKKIDNMNRATKLLDIAIKTITLIKFYENYMGRNGRFSWETYTEKLVQVPFSTAVWNRHVESIP